MAFKIDSISNDLLIENGNLVLVKNEIEGIDQHLRARLKTFLGEWFLDSRIGVPYFQQILGNKNPSTNLISAIFRREILKSSGVTSVKNLSVGLDAKLRELVVSFEATTANGVIIFTENFEV